MKVIYHRLAVRDACETLDHYEWEAGQALADRFFADLLATLAQALANLNHFPPLGETLRRANLTDPPITFSTR